MQRQGKATRPLHLPTRAPPCFRNQEQWNQYREAAVYSAANGFTFCSDCTQERRDEMIKQHRCTHPQTVFYRPNGALIGRRKV